MFRVLQVEHILRPERPKAYPGSVLSHPLIPIQDRSREPTKPDPGRIPQETNDQSGHPSSGLAESERRIGTDPTEEPHLFPLIVLTLGGQNRPDPLRFPVALSDDEPAQPELLALSHSFQALVRLNDLVRWRPNPILHPLLSPEVLQEQSVGPWDQLRVSQEAR